MKLYLDMSTVSNPLRLLSLYKNVEDILKGIIDGINGKYPGKKDAFLQMQAKLAEL